MLMTNMTSVQNKVMKRMIVMIKEDNSDNIDEYDDENNPKTDRYHDFSHLFRPYYFVK